MPLPADLAALPAWGFAFPGPLRDELTALALDGVKTTTAGLFAEMEVDGRGAADPRNPRDPPRFGRAPRRRDRNRATAAWPASPMSTTGTPSTRARATPTPRNSGLPTSASGTATSMTCGEARQPGVRARRRHPRRPPTVQGRAATRQPLTPESGAPGPHLGCGDDARLRPVGRDRDQLRDVALADDRQHDPPARPATRSDGSGRTGRRTAAPGSRTRRRAGPSLRADRAARHVDECQAQRQAGGARPPGRVRARPRGRSRRPRSPRSRCRPGCR